MDKRALEHKSLPIAIGGCLVAATSSPEAALACRRRLESVPGERPGPAMVRLFRRMWEMSAEQARVMQAWPRSQVLLLRAAAIEACRLAEDGLPLQCRGVARVGTPRSISVSLSEDNYLEITFVGPKIV